MRQRLGLLLSTTVLLTSVFPTGVYASEQKAADVNEYFVNAEEVATDTNFKGDANEQLEVSAHEDDEVVTVIVELKDAAVLEYYDGSEASESQESVGDAVAEYLASDEAKKIEKSIIKKQNTVIKKVEALSDDAEVITRWTNVMNGFAVEIPYGELDEINEISQVSHAYVQHVYERPETQTNSIDLTKQTFQYSMDMVDVNGAWEAGYTGKGMLVAILDTGIEIIQNKATGEFVTSHEAFSDDSFMNDPADEENGWELRYTFDSMKSFLAETTLWANTSAVDNETHINYDNNALYKNSKVPFGYDYADLDVHTRPASSDHGTHVAGTVAGYSEDEAGNVLFSGVAPDAQILAMKVFPDAEGGAEELSLVCALEDSVKLGADIINLSLGSDNGYADDDTYQNRVFANVAATGIVLMTSAGNSSDSTDDNNYGGYNLASDPETSMMSSPAVYESNLAVASIDNLVSVQNYFNAVNGETKTEVYYSDTLGTFAAKLDGTEYPIIPVGGTGTSSDYYAAGFDNGYNGGKTGIALVKRGELSFADKITNASNYHGTNYRTGKDYGVVGVIVYNNVETDDLISMSVDGTSIPSCFISGNNGKALLEAINNGDTVSVETTYNVKTTENKTAGQMSEFSSWGAGSGLELKPEITAPGGNVWSSVINKNCSAENYVSKYEMMSGTSMAAPHMTGIGALVRQRVNTEAATSELSNVEKGELVQELLVSTALPQVDENGVFYSPRLQGSGLVNAAAAIKTPAYISVEGKKVGKLELGDDVEKTGKYDFEFKVNNLSDTALTYAATVTLMTPAVETDEDGTYYTTKNDVVIGTYDLGTITVAANGTTTVSDSVELSADVKADLDEKFANGIYVEGFITLTDPTAAENPTLGLPLLAFYGDWTKAPIFDAATWLEAQDGESIYNNECTWNNSILGSVLTDSNGNQLGYFNLGENLFAKSQYEQKVFYENNVAISPNGDGYMDAIDDIILYQVRNAKAVVFEARDTETNELYYKDVISCCSKTVYESSYGFAVPYTLYYSNLGWDGTDLNGDVLPDGTTVNFVVTAYNDGDYSSLGTTVSDYYHMDVTDFMNLTPGETEPTFNGHAMDKTGDVISTRVLIDTTAPFLKNNAVSISERDGRIYLKASVYDEVGSLASVEVAPIVKRTSKYYAANFDYAADRNNAFLSEVIYDENKSTYTVEVDVTEYAHTVESYNGENNVYDFTWEGNIILSVGDYAGNDRSYAISVNAEPGIVLSQTSALLEVGDKFTLSVNNNTGDEDAVLTRTSSNPEVATVNEFGLVTAVAAGQTLITVSNGETSAICVIAVRETPTEVLDFDLSITDIKGLKPDGQATVYVKNLYPADVELNEIKWEISEDDDYAENYAEGLVTVIKNTENGLSGSVCLNATASQEAHLPAGHATLKVTLNGVTREADVTWDDVYDTSDEDGLVSNELYQEQVIMTPVGEAAEFTTKYRTNKYHEVGDILAELEGLELDGADFFYRGGSYTCKLVPKKGYALPSSITMYTRYDYGSGSYYDSTRYADSDYGYRYNSSTGEITVKNAPTGTTSLRIVATGVADESNTADPVLSDETYAKPDGLYGPFDWEVVSGDGELEVVDFTNNYGETYKKAKFTPASVGVSYIKATSKEALDEDGNPYTITFAVVAEPVIADKLTVENHRAECSNMHTVQLNATLSEIPTLDKDKELIWTSFDESVATVSEDGLVTGVSEGYAYIKVASRANTSLTNYFIVHVNPYDETEHSYATPVFKWAANGKSCQIVFDCENDENHQETYDCVVTSKVTKAATCSSKGQTTYTATYGELKETKVLTDIPMIAHPSTKETITPATTAKDGKIVKTCTKCKTVISTTVIKKISSVSVAKSSYTYTGKAIDAAIVVKDSAGKTISSSYYTVTYKNNKYIGTATATIKFKGRYSGTVTKSFTIVPRGTTVSKVTSYKKELHINWKKPAEATGVLIQVATDSKFTKNVKSVYVAGNYTGKYISGLKAKTKYYVRICTYKTVGSKKVYSGWAVYSKTATTK